MSTMALVEGPNGVVGGWDTDGQIYFAKVKPGTEVTKPQSIPGPGKAQKHPALAITARGEMILVWTEGTGWQKGGALAWHVFDKAGKATEKKGRRERGIPVWGLPTVVATDRDFIIIH
jgi:hypothetical protein